VQPWRNTKKYELKENAIFFDKNGYAHSADWVDVPWLVRGNLVCMEVNKKDSCYQAFADSTSGQAYLLAQSSNLLAHVKLIEDGDTKNIKAVYNQKQEQLAAQQEMQMAFLGLMFEALAGGGGGYSGGSDASLDAHRLEQNQARWAAQDAEAARQSAGAWNSISNTPSINPSWSTY
jgi:hypothetical protein